MSEKIDNVVVDTTGVVSLYSTQRNCKNIIFRLDFVLATPKIGIIISHPCDNEPRKTMEFFVNSDGLRCIITGISTIVAQNANGVSKLLTKIYHTNNDVCTLYISTGSNCCKYLNIYYEECPLVKFPLPDDISKYISDLEELYNKLKVID